eukprot:175440-Rhodomonas_salina.2
MPKKTNHAGTELTVVLVSAIECQYGRCGYQTPGPSTDLVENTDLPRSSTISSLTLWVGYRAVHAEHEALCALLPLSVRLRWTERLVACNEYAASSVVPPGQTRVSVSLASRGSQTLCSRPAPSLSRRALVFSCSSRHLGVRLFADAT